jgi:hypothetical protein
MTPAFHRTARPRALALALLAATALSGCRDDQCRGGVPSFQLDLSLSAGVDGSRVTNLLLTIDAAGRHKQFVSATGSLADGKTSLVVDVGDAGKGGFIADVSVDARDDQGRTLARGQGRFPGSGDACNFFSLVLSASAADGLRDSAADAPRDSAPGDGRRGGDMRSDLARPPDVPKPDWPKPDTAKPDSVPPPCALGPTSYLSLSGLLAACETANAVGQCQAGTLCAAGWHLCTATEYKAVFPAASLVPLSAADAWIASCVRQGAVTAPTNAVCGSPCYDASSTQVTIAWDCKGATPVSSTAAAIGVKSATTCARVGGNTPVCEGMWAPHPAGQLLVRSLCCRP